MQALSYFCPRSRYSTKIADETEAKNHGVEIENPKRLEACETESTVHMFWRRWYVAILELSAKEKEIFDYQIDQLLSLGHTL